MQKVRKMLAITKDSVLATLRRIALPDGGDLVSHDFVRALSVTEGSVRFVIEAPTAELAQKMGPIRQAAEDLVRSMEGVTDVSVVLTAHSGGQAAPAASASKAPPSLKIGMLLSPLLRERSQVFWVHLWLGLRSGSGPSFLTSRP